MNTPDLRARLDQLEQHIQTAESHLKQKGLFSADHQVTAAELRTRYKMLSAKVQADVADAEAQGHHVTDLEKSLRQWLDSLEMEID